jgi:ferredoxin
MAISTSRTSENATITIDSEKCNGCGICVNVCKDFSLVLDGKKVKLSDTALFGCIGCGHCVAVCAREAISVTGRTLAASDYQPLQHSQLHYDSLYKMVLNRRSIRDFHDQPVPQEIVDKIIQFASTAPMGIPPSDVGVLIIEGKEKVKQFAFDFVDLLSGMQFMVSPYVMPLMRPFMKRDDYKMMGEFVRPLVNIFVKGRKEGKDYVLYEAPLVMMFYGKLSDPADPYIAATYATLAAESMGIGSCMIGSIGPFLKHTGKAFKKKYNIPQNLRDSLFVIMGYPKYKFRKTIKRSFASVDRIS